MTIIAECRSTFAVRLNMREKKSRVGRKTSKNRHRATETLIYQNRRYIADTAENTIRSINQLKYACYLVGSPFF